MSYFTRTQNPILTILLPSRNRFDMCKSTINSFLDKCNNKNNIQVILKFDTDDISSIERISELPSDIKLNTIISDRKQGYHSLHEYCNEMLEYAVGDWVLFMNDDSTMETKDWDIILENASPTGSFGGSKDLALLNPKGQIEFPFVRTSICKKLGYFALHNHVDSFLQDIYVKLNARTNVNIDISHKRDLMTDRTRMETAAAAQLTSPTYGPFIKNNYEKIASELKRYL